MLISVYIHILCNIYLEIYVKYNAHILGSFLKIKIHIYKYKDKNTIKLLLIKHLVGSITVLAGEGGLIKIRDR